MGQVSSIVAKFRKSDRGATAIEYALIAALVATSVLSGAQAISNRVNKNLKCADNVLTAKFKDDGRGPCAPFEKTPRPER